MTDWPATDLAAIAATDDLHVAPVRDDGATLGTPTWIWSVVVDADLYVRAYNGIASSWYQAAIRHHAGVIEAAGRSWPVRFDRVPAGSEPGFDAGLDAAVDAAYRAKYGGSRYLGHMIAAGSRAATVVIRPAPPESS